MNKTYSPRRLKILFAVTLIISTLTACASSLDEDKGAALEKTISVQSTRIAHLSTEVAQHDQSNASQWEAISYLSTQMPLALGLITSTPPGVTITPTPYIPNDQGTGSTFTPTPYFPNDQGSGSTFTPTPSASIDIEYPPDMRTSIEEIDRVIDAILGKDLNPRLNLIRLTTTACTTADGLGGPPTCEPGEADGTIVDACPISAGEGYHVRPDNVPAAFDFTVRGLFAVYVVPEDAYNTDYWPAGEYGIVFTSEDNGYPHVITVLVEDGQIVRLAFNPDWPPFDLVGAASDEFILPPMR
jgi:hypothetical protein